MNIRKALITCAGFGTRFLPISKTIQKEMLPILNRPMIDYVVADCISAGITEIIFVVKENETHLVEHFYSESELLQTQMQSVGQGDKYAKAYRPIPEGVKFTFITQLFSDGYGTAIPVKLVKEQLQGEDAFIVFMGDDFIYHPQSVATTEMIELFQNSNSQALVTCITKPDSELHKYGVAETKTENGFTYLTNLVEKPAPGTAPTNLINISKYIFTPKIFALLETQEPNTASGEYYITDTATVLAQTDSVVVYTPNGKYLDGGNVLNWLKANLTVAKDDPELYQGLKEFISNEF